MPSTQPTGRTARTVLVSGSGIAGPALAHRLHRYGFEVTVVEKADAVRDSGYPVDIRGTALEAVRRMGLLPRMREAHIDTRRLTFVDAEGATVAVQRPESLTGGVAGRDIEIRRGDLVTILYEAVRDDVAYRLGDSIAALHEHADGVDVTFDSGARHTFDLVVGADGMHSRTRRLAFGTAAHVQRHLGYCFAGFTVPNHLGLSHEGVVCNTPGRAAILYGPGDTSRLHAFLAFAHDEPSRELLRDPAAQRELTASVFAGGGWEVPRMLDGLRTADDLFFDAVGQIRMSDWSRGRVALVGDAAHAPSFLSGQGSSLALAGAYVLAGELATAGGHRAAFAGYERTMRKFVELNQDLAPGGAAALLPRTAEELARRDRALRAPAQPRDNGGDPAHTALTLPDYRR